MEKRARYYAYVITEMTDGHVSFRHDFLWADNEQDAYRRAHNARQTGVSFIAQPTGNGLNDYIFEVEW
jgi:hypothetical protein